MAGGRNVPGGHERGRSARGRENDGFRAMLEEDHVGIELGNRDGGAKKGLQCVRVSGEMVAGRGRKGLKLHSGPNQHPRRVG